MHEAQSTTRTTISVSFLALLCLYVYEMQYSFVVRPDTTRRWGWCFGETMGKLRSIRRELERRRGCAKISALRTRMGLSI
jgi:hypothetical protein